MSTQSDLKIYTCFAATPARVLSLVRLLRIRPEAMPADEVDGWLHPPSLRTGEGAGRSSQVAEIVAAANELKLVSRTGLGEVALALELQADVCPDENLVQEVARKAAKTAFAPSTADTPNGFVTLTAWWCHQKVFWLPETTEDLQQRLTDQGFDLDALKVRNDQRWDMLRYWWQFFGLAANMTTAANRGKLPGLMPDATGFLSTHLRELTPTPGKPVAIGTFLETLGGLCAALDGGSVCQDVGDTIGVGHGLTGALSMGLLRLEQRGVLRAWCPDDQREFVITKDDRRVAFVAATDGALP